MGDSPDDEERRRSPRYVDAVLSGKFYFRIDLEEKRVIEGIAPSWEMSEAIVETVRTAEPPYEAKIRGLRIFQHQSALCKLPALRVQDLFLFNPDLKLDRSSVAGMDPPAILSRVLGDADIGRVDLTDIFLADLADFLCLAAPPEGPLIGCLTMDDEGRFLGVRWFPEPPSFQEIFNEEFLPFRLLITCDLVDDEADVLSERQDWIVKLEEEAGRRGSELHDHLVIRRGENRAEGIGSIRYGQAVQEWRK